MPRSIFLGRPWPQPGESLFLQEDTDYALALHQLEAQEAADRCPLCGLPKLVCRAPENQYGFEPEAERCHATWAILQRQDRLGGDDVHNRSLAWSAKVKS